MARSMGGCGRGASRRGLASGSSRRGSSVCLNAVTDTGRSRARGTARRGSPRSSSLASSRCWPSSSRSPCGPPTPRPTACPARPPSRPARRGRPPRTPRCRAPTATSLPALGNAIKWRSREWLNIWADYLNVPRVPSKGQRPGNANCLKCHSLNGDPRSSTATSACRTSSTWIMRNLTCADCHDQVAHPKPGSSGTGCRWRSAACATTQNGAPAECNVCHITPPPTDVAPQGLPRDARRAGARRSRVVPALPPQQGGVLRPVPRPADARPLLRHVALHSRTHRQEGSCVGCTGLSRRRHVLRAVPQVSTRPTGCRPTVAVAAQSPGACLVCHPQACATQLPRAEGREAMTRRRIAVVLRRAGRRGSASALPAAAAASTAPPSHRRRSAPRATTPASAVTASRTCRRRTIDVDGQQKSLFVDRAVYDASRHGRLACTSCHIGFEPGPHDAGQTQAWLVTAKLTACRNCHADVFDMYRGSFHGDLVFGESSGEAPVCADCHVAHNITPPDSPRRSARPSTLCCARCHARRSCRPTSTATTARRSARQRADRRLHRLPRRPQDPAAVQPREHGLASRTSSPPARSVTRAPTRTSPASWSTSTRRDPTLVVRGLDSSGSLYVLLIAVVFTFGFVHTALYIYRGIKDGLYRRNRHG